MGAVSCVEGVDSGCGEWGIPSIEEGRDSLARLVFDWASQLLTPMCHVREWSVRAQVVDALHPLASRVNRVAEKVFLWLGVLFFSVMAVLTTGPGLVLRKIGCELQSKPYIHVKGKGVEKSLEGDEFSLLSWNCCGPAAGYSITDGGVLPWPDRIDGIIERIKKADADIVNLCEVFDQEMAGKLIEKLGYAHFYYNIGPRVIGPSSGLFIASRFPLDVMFTPFPDKALHGRARFTAKGICRLDLKGRVTILTTHMQHSEAPAYPIAGEVEARRKEMEMIAERINGVVVVAGDFNMTPEEMVPWSHLFEPSGVKEATWGGDEFCAGLTKGKQISGSLILDYALIKRGCGTVFTELLPDCFKGNQYSREALSDHLALKTRVKMKASGRGG